MEDLLERPVADVAGSGEGNERKREPFAHERNVSRPEQWERVRFHGADVRRELLGVVAGTGPVWAGDEDHEGLSAGHGPFLGAIGSLIRNATQPAAGVVFLFRRFRAANLRFRATS